VIAAATGLRRAGLVLVPHITARSFPSFTQLDDFRLAAGGR